MNLDDYQQAALRTVNPSLDDRDRLIDATAGLAEESAELLGLIRKRVFQHREIDAAKLKEELGDVLWCLAVTADTLGFSLSNIAEANQAKLATRHPNGFRSPAEWSRSVKE
ncbi:MAG TPA: nucleoside triphosphate pyrophosphohydrolase family protein [Gemmatimonadaceae bacterium]